MKRFSRLYEQTAEFRARCKAFDFAIVAHAVLDVIVAAKKKLTAWWNRERPHAPAKVMKCHQLVLELDDIAQMPLFQKRV